jgi:hypothetical protein
MDTVNEILHVNILKIGCMEKEKRIEELGFMTMKNIWKWIAIIITVLIIFSILGFSFIWRFGYNMIPMIDGGFRGSHMFNGYGFYGGNFLMFGISIFPILIIGLLLWFGVSLTKSSAKSLKESSSAIRNCDYCDEVLQAGWVNCPYCGEKV